MVPVVEIFSSLQGEGERAGVPSIFVRTGLCNFRCEGFGCTIVAPDGETVTGCDSIRAVSPKFKDRWKQFIDYEDFVKEIESYFPQYDKHNIIKPDIVFTGGEPLLFWKDDVYQRTLSYFLSRHHKVTIETNASLDIDFFREYQKKIQFSMSVKLSNSGEPEHKRINIDTITKMLEYGNNSYLKFVVSKDSWDNDFKEIKGILKRIPIFAPVYLMPLGETQTHLEKNAKFVFEKCIELGFCYSDRLHIRCFNDKEAV